MTICYIATYLRNGLLESIQKDPNYDARNLLTTKIKKMAEENLFFKRTQGIQGGSHKNNSYRSHG